MYAIIQTGGKQYTVKPGDVVQVEKLEMPLGEEFDLSEVLAIGGDTTILGQPLVKNAKVTAVVTMQAKTRKVLVFKKKRRQGYRRTQGHRQPFTQLFIKSITTPDGKTVKADAQPKVVDMAAKREAQLTEAQEARAQRVQARLKGEAPVKKAAAPKKKKAPAKKAGAKKASAKKTAKKAGAKKAKKTK